MEWYAQYQYDNGKVPCCVDEHGATPVPENDSHGELIYLTSSVLFSKKLEHIKANPKVSLSISDPVAVRVERSRL